MIQARDLRIGNWVHLIRAYNEPNGIEIQVSIDSFHITSELKPIPLTEEWLLKFGFEVYGDLASMNVPTWTLKKIKKSKPCWGVSFWMGGADLEYVHQLQNLYFALTGEELTIKE